MRILHCIPSMGIGGAERQLAYFSRGMTGLGHEVHVFLLQGGPLLEALETAGAVVHKIDVSSNYSPSIFLEIGKLIRELKPTLLQTNFRQMDIVGGLAAQRPGLPWIISERTSDLAYPVYPKNFIRSRLGRLARGVIANSVSGRGYWISSGIRSERAFVIPNAIPFPAIDHQRVSDEILPGFIGNKKIVVCVSRLVQSKNVNSFVLAMAAVLKKFPCQVLICGDGPERKKIGETVARLGLKENVFLLGEVSCIWGLLKRASVFVSLSEYEGCPNAVLEAMACRCPMVLSDIPAHREICHANLASFVSHKGLHSVSREVLRLLSEPEAATRQANCARAHVERYSIESMTSGYLKAYSELL